MVRWAGVPLSFSTTFSRMPSFRVRLIWLPAMRLSSPTEKSMAKPVSNAVMSVITSPVIWLPLPRKFTPADAARWIRMFRKVFRSPSNPTAELPSSVMTLPDSRLSLPTTNNDPEFRRSVLSVTRLFDASRSSAPICGFVLDEVPAHRVAGGGDEPYSLAVRRHDGTCRPASGAAVQHHAGVEPGDGSVLDGHPVPAGDQDALLGVARGDPVAGHGVPGQIEDDVVRAHDQRGAGAAGEVVWQRRCSPRA
jgi:hypothetical protein